MPPRAIIERLLRGADEVPPDIHSNTSMNSVEDLDVSILAKESMQQLIVSITVAFLLRRLFWGKNPVTHSKNLNDSVDTEPKPDIEKPEGLIVDKFISGIIEEAHLSSETKEDIGEEASSQPTTASISSDNGLHVDNLISDIIEEAHSSSAIKEDDNPSQQTVPSFTTTGSLNVDNFMSAITEAAHMSSKVKTDNTDDVVCLQADSFLHYDEATHVQLNTKAEHPGLEAYYRWKASLVNSYRVFSIPLYLYQQNTDDINDIKETLLLEDSSLEQTKTEIRIEVTNQTSHTIAAFRVDSHGNEIYQGTILRTDWLNVTTQVGQQWIFRIKRSDDISEDPWTSQTKDQNDRGTGLMLLKYIPLRMIPFVRGFLHEKDHDLSAEVHYFTLRDAPTDQRVVVDGKQWKPACLVEDTLAIEPQLVSPSEKNADETYNEFMEEIYKALRWSFDQLEREETITPGRGLAAAKQLKGHLSKVSLSPWNTRYRKIRINDPVFMQNVYCTGAKGVLLALGFEEHNGYFECGASEGKLLTQDRISMMSDVTVMLSIFLRTMEKHN